MNLSREKVGDVSLVVGQSSRRVSIQDVSKVTGRSKQRRSKKVSLVLHDTPPSLRKDVSQLHAADFTPIRPSSKANNNPIVDNESAAVEKESQNGSELKTKQYRKKIPSFQLIETPPKIKTRRSTRLSSIPNHNISKPAKDKKTSREKR